MKVANDSAFARLTSQPDLFRPYMDRHFKSQDHGFRFFLKLLMAVHDRMCIRSRALNMGAKIKQVPIALQNSHHFCLPLSPISSCYIFGGTQICS